MGIVDGSCAERSASAHVWVPIVAQRFIELRSSPAPLSTSPTYVLPLDDSLTALLGLGRTAVVFTAIGAGDCLCLAGLTCGAAKAPQRRCFGILRRPMSNRRTTSLSGMSGNWLSSTRLRVGLRRFRFCMAAAVS